jgi:hypothetical protein
MKQFDYNKYLKNNPLLKESIDEATYPLSQRSELNAIQKLMSVISSYGFKQVATPKSPYPKQELFFAGFQNQEGDKIRLGISKGDRAPFASIIFAGSDRPNNTEQAPIIYDKTYWKEILSTKKNSEYYKDEDIQDQLEDLDMEIYRTEEELNALDDEGEDTTELEKELISLEALKDKLIKKLGKLK